MFLINLYCFILNMTHGLYLFVQNIYLQKPSLLNIFCLLPVCCWNGWKIKISPRKDHKLFYCAFDQFKNNGTTLSSGGTDYVLQRAHWLIPYAGCRCPDIQRTKWARCFLARSSLRRLLLWLSARCVNTCAEQRGCSRRRRAHFL